MRFFSTLVICTVLAVGSLGAQTVTSAQQAILRAELAQRGLTEAEARAGLAKAGIDLDTVPVAQLPMLQAQVVGILDRLAAEKRAVTDTGVKVAATPVTPAEIATVRAAVADAVVRAALPDDDSRIYGHELFQNKSLEVYRTTDGTMASDSYVLGAGDVIRVSIFSASPAEFMLEINAEGYVEPTGVPRVFLQGLTLGRARSILQDRFDDYFAIGADQFVVTVRTTRSVTINVFGEVSAPGSYSLSALNSALNALVAAGGPTRIGSVRAIEVIRGGQRRTIDVYDFMRDPQRMFSLDLQHNDVIFVPVARTVVRVSGAVKRAQRYELRDGEGLRELIGYAGGLNFDSFVDFVQVQRVEGDSVVLREWPLDQVLSGATAVPLRDGDAVRVREVARPLSQVIDVEGAVFYGGQYALSSSPTLASALARAGIQPQAKTDVVYIERRLDDGTRRIIPVRLGASLAGADTVRLQPLDRIIVFTQARYTDAAMLRVQGTVRAAYERELAFGDRIRLADAIELGGGLAPTAAPVGYIFRTNLADPERVQHIRVEFARDANLPVGAGDRIVVYDLRTYTDVGELSVRGAVRNEVVTRFDANVSMVDLLTMAGGLAQRAASNRVDVIRLRIDQRSGATFDRIPLTVDSTYAVIGGPSNFQLQPFDQVIVRSIPLFSTSRNVRLDGAVLYPGTYALATDRTYLSDVISEAGGLSPLADTRGAVITRAATGGTQITVDLQRTLRERRNPEADPVLLEGDVVTFRPRQNVFQIDLRATRLGELQSRGLTDQLEGGRAGDRTQTFIFEGRKSARWYIENFAGGFTKDADKLSVTVTDPAGRVQATKRVLFFFKDYPDVDAGSRIAVAPKPVQPEGEKKNVDWDAVFNRTFQAVTTLVSLAILATRL